MNVKTLSQPSTLPLDLLQIIGGSLFIALSAKIAIPLFFSPVPLTLHTLAVMLLALTLGRTKATLAVITYIAECGMGLPFLTASGSIFGPTGGYLAGMVAQAYLIGWVKDQEMKNSIKVLFCVTMASLLQLAMGCAWLANFVGVSNVLAMGFYPFAIGESVKALFATSTYIKS